MKASDLRIGNFAKLGNRILQVNGRLIKEQQQAEKIKGEIYLESIPLTENWFLDFGFVQTGKSFEFWESSVFNVEYLRNHWHVSYKSNVLCTHIKSVHQLQNLYHALTGEELISKKH